MTSGKHELEAITVRRAKLTDAGKVRYRVYTSPTEFIAVIAESALMAVRVSGVKVPFKIMRDLPTDGVAIDAQKMAEIDAQAETVKFRLHHEEKPQQRLTELEAPENVRKLPFVPVGIADLRSKGGNRARILPPEMVNQIIEDHAKEQAPPPPPAPPPAPEPIVEAVHETVEIPEPELSAAEKITMMANEMFEPETPKDPNAGLTPEEVEALLNEKP